MARRGDALYLRGKTWYLDCCINGTRYQRRLGKGITRSVALELATVERGEILKCEAGIGKKAKDIRFDDARKKFEGWAEAEKRATTLRGYEQCLERLAHGFGGKRLGEITAWTIESYKKGRVEGKQLSERPPGLSDAEWNRRCRQAEKGAPIRVNRELAVLKTLFNRCKDWGLYEGENPVCAVKFRKEPKTRLRWLETDEEQRLLNAASEPLRTFIVVGIYTGLRIHAEALTLKWEDVDLRRGTVTVQAAWAKNGRTRTVPLNSRVRAALTNLKATAQGDYVFTSQDGTPLRSIRTAFKTACKRAALSDVTPHSLRHTFSSRLVMSGVDFRTVQDLAGWQTIAMVERYSHLSPAHKAQAVEKLAEFPYAIPYAEKSALAVAP